MTEAKLSRSAAEGAAQSLARHLNRVLNRTVSDSHLSVSPIDGDGDTFELTRLVERQDVDDDRRIKVAADVWSACRQWWLASLFRAAACATHP